MSIVRLALRRSYIFMVMAILIAIMGGLSIVTTPTARRVLFGSERAMTTTVSNRAHAFGAAGDFLGRS